MELSRHTELLEGVVNQLIDEEALGVCFELHRAINLGYYELLYPEESVYDKQPIVDVRGLDIFGNAPLGLKKNIDCLCPNCSRTLGAQKFAPHLEKCMGMGRNSTRIAANSKKQKATVDSDQEGSDDNEEDWTYSESRHKAARKSKKDKTTTSSPHRSGRGPGRPPKQHKEKGLQQHGGESTSNVTDFRSIKPSQMMHTVHSFKSLPTEHKTSLLDHICGVVSERTGRLCTRSVNCPQHMEEQRSELRSILLAERTKSIDLHAPPPAKKSRRSSHGPEASEELEAEGFPHGSKGHKPSSSPLLHSDSTSHMRRDTLTSHVKKKKNKMSKKGKRGHGITMATTVLHSSPLYRS